MTTKTLKVGPVTGGGVKALPTGAGGVMPAMTSPRPPLRVSSAVRESRAEAMALRTSRSRSPRGCTTSHSRGVLRPPLDEWPALLVPCERVEHPVGEPRDRQLVLNHVFRKPASQF